MQPAGVRFFTYEEIGRIAAGYLERCGLAKGIPVNIELLLDNILKINIIPFPSLYRGFEVNAFISNDFRKIYVDEYLYSCLEPQYRFTLAHELGHMVLHHKWYRQFKIDSIDAYLEFVYGLGDEEYRLLETQANYFAGLFLVPAPYLETKFREKAKDIVSFITARFKGLSREKYLGTAVELIAQKLSPDFNVHYLPIRFRIEKDRLFELIP